MATGSTVLDANQTGSAYNSDVNIALAALNSANSGATAPTDEVVTGKFWVDTNGTDPVLNIYRNGWKPLFTLLAASTEVEADKADITNEVRIGASNELVIAQDTTLSEIRSNNLAIQNLAGTENYITAVADGAVSITHNNLTKLATTATGITVTGTITATALTATGLVTAANFNTTSDRRLKDNIEYMASEESLDIVLKLDGVRYSMGGKKNIGLIAQEVKNVIPEAVIEREDGFLGINYGNMVAHLIEAIKEQQYQIVELKGEIDELRSRIEE